MGRFLIVVYLNLFLFQYTQGCLCCRPFCDKIPFCSPIFNCFEDCFFPEIGFEFMEGSYYNRFHFSKFLFDNKDDEQRFEEIKRKNKIDKRYFEMFIIPFVEHFFPENECIPLLESKNILPEYSVYELNVFRYFSLIIKNENDDCRRWFFVLSEKCKGEIEINVFSTHMENYSDNELALLEKYNIIGYKRYNIHFTFNGYGSQNVYNMICNDNGITDDYIKKVVIPYYIITKVYRLVWDRSCITYCKEIYRRQENKFNSKGISYIHILLNSNNILLVLLKLRSLHGEGDDSIYVAIKINKDDPNNLEIICALDYEDIIINKIDENILNEFNEKFSNVSEKEKEGIIKDKEHDTCIICLESYKENENIVRLKNCIHTYHRECIYQWLQQENNYCPMCKRKIV